MHVTTTSSMTIDKLILSTVLTNEMAGHMLYDVSSVVFSFPTSFLIVYELLHQLINCSWKLEGIGIE